MISLSWWLSSNLDWCFLSIGNGLRGLLSNFTSLELAILAGEYDRDFQSIASRPNLDSASIYEYLTIQDTQLAADLMKAVYDRPIE
jgi:hypothetical protein